MTAYRLHYFPESGNSYKLALMLTLCGQTFEPVWTDFGGGVTRTPEWRRTVNVMGEIPVLEIDGVAHAQTAPILLRLATHAFFVTNRDNFYSEGQPPSLQAQAMHNLDRGEDAERAVEFPSVTNRVDMGTEQKRRSA